MIILDTNIVSEIMKPEPEPNVLKWYNSTGRELIWQNAISVYEIQFGLSLMSDGRKKEALQRSFNRMLREKFSQRIIAFDVNAAVAAAELNAAQKRSGRNCDIRDEQIAGIALARGACLATRNVKDFEFKGLKVINPFVNE
ncbi:MAG: type II toxin-antitoxin system VapC family toxin [Lewinella sp.]|uniref:type II toxin-antitoxin system VapC family toxin n=1 Tax=Lewinella sp. TaxID=2004506 RepID=UPI003D6A15E1